MLSGALSQALAHPKRLAGALATDPIGLFEKLQDRLVQRWEYRSNPVHIHQPSPNWENDLHQHLGCDWPCGAQTEFAALWPKVIAEVREQGINVGPASFAGFNDGDRALLRAIWCLVRHLKPLNVVETGVGHGFTSRLVLEALVRNGDGHLSSIDRPPLDPVMQRRIGIAVPQELRRCWRFLPGSSRRCLPRLLSQLGTINLFIHDSLHTERNVRFELDRSWAALNPGGALVIDDIDSNGGYGSFCGTFQGFRGLVCEAEPIRPDERRFNRKGLFAIVLKECPSAGAKITTPAEELASRQPRE